MIFECRLTQTRNVTEQSWWDYLKTVQEPAKKNALEAHLASWPMYQPVPTVLYVTSQEVPDEWYCEPEIDERYNYNDDDSWFG